MRSKLVMAGLATAMLAGTAGMALAQYAPSGDQTWAQPGQWQWAHPGYPPEPPWGSAYRSYPYYGDTTAYYAPYDEGYYGTTYPPYGYRYDYNYWGYGR